MKMRKLHVWMVGLALGAGLPAVPAYAQRGEDGGQAERIDKNRVPDRALQALQQQMGAGATHVTYHRVERGNRTLYEARFEAANGQRERVQVAADGTVVGPGAIGERGGDRTAPRNTGQVAVPTTATPSLRDEFHRLNAEVARYNQVIAQAAQAGRRGDRETGAARDRLIGEQQRIIAERQQVINQLAQSDSQFTPVPVPSATDDRPSEERGQLVQEYQRLNSEVSRYDQMIAQQAQLLQSGDRTAGTTRDRLIGEQTRIAGERDQLASRVARFEREGGSALAGGSLPGERRGGVGGASDFGTDQDRDRSDDDRDVHYAPITAERVPVAVLNVLDRYTRNATDVRYRREVRGDRVSYSAHYILPDNGKRYWVSVSESGTVRVEPRLSIYQPEDDRARTAGDRLDGRDRRDDLDRGRDRLDGRDRPDDRNRPDDRDRTGRDNFRDADAGRLTRVEQEDLPREVLRAATRAGERDDARNWGFYRTQDGDYVGLYQTRNNERREVVIDRSGNLVSGPRVISNPRREQ